MDFFPFFQWLSDLAPFMALRESGLAYPIVLTSHLTGMALFGGMILLTDLRILGVTMTSYPLADVVDQLRPWKRIGFVLTATCGALLFASKATEYYPNPYFWTKMSLLVLVAIHALVFRPTVYNRAAEIDKAGSVPSRAKVAACLSLVLWIGLVSAGRMIGYYEAPRTQAVSR